ncbi:VOC family protein [Tropicibacter sp. S64]|uniref:VOC family protein n=1 Tax=Tropicibacter sp. S64 TaxID=3415122 RepID=UPI003C7DD0FC
MEPTLYLYFNGDCFEAMSFYEKTLGGEIMGVFRNADAPSADDRMPGGDHLVMNMAMRLGHTMIMASDSPDSWYSKPQGFSISLAPKSVEDFDRLFDALAENAQAVTMPPGETFWAERFAMFKDRFGTPFMLNYEGNRAQS